MKYLFFTHDLHIMLREDFFKKKLSLQQFCRVYINLKLTCSATYRLMRGLTLNSTIPFLSSLISIEINTIFKRRNHLPEHYDI